MYATIWKKLWHKLRNMGRYSDMLRAEESRDRIPVAERSKAKVCGRRLAGIAGSNPAGDKDVWPEQTGHSSTDKAQRENKKKSRWRRDFPHPSRTAPYKTETKSSSRR